MNDPPKMVHRSTISELKKDDEIIGYEHIAIVDGVKVVVRTDINHEPGTIFPDRDQGGVNE